MLKIYKINKDGKPINIMVVKEYKELKDRDAILDQYIENELKTEQIAPVLDETNKTDRMNKVLDEVNKTHRMFKVLVEDKKIIKERTDKWKKKLADCFLDKNSHPNCADVLKAQIKLPEFNMDILVVDKNDILEDPDVAPDDAPDVALTAPDVAPVAAPDVAPAAHVVAPAATPFPTNGGTRRRRRNNKKSKRKSKNNRKKTNRRR